MRKIFLLLLLAALLLCACGAAPAEETSQPDAAQDDPTPLNPAVQEELAALLGEVRQNVSIGTAGSSLRAAAMAAKLLDWAEDARIPDVQIRGALEPWLGQPEDGVPADFLEQLQAVDGMVSRLTGDSAEEAEGILSDAGCEDCGYPWSDEAAATVARIMALAGLRDTDSAK